MHHMLNAELKAVHESNNSKQCTAVAPVNVIHKQFTESLRWWPCLRGSSYDQAIRTWHATVATERSTHTVSTMTINGFTHRGKGANSYLSWHWRVSPWHDMLYQYFQAVYLLGKRNIDCHERERDWGLTMSVPTKCQSLCRTTGAIDSTMFLAVKETVPLHYVITKGCWESNDVKHQESSLLNLYATTTTSIP